MLLVCTAQGGKSVYVVVQFEHTEQVQVYEVQLQSIGTRLDLVLEETSGHWLHVLDKIRIVSTTKVELCFRESEGLKTHKYMLYNGEEKDVFVWCLIRICASSLNFFPLCDNFSVDHLQAQATSLESRCPILSKTIQLHEDSTFEGPSHQDLNSTAILSTAEESELVDIQEDEEVFSLQEIEAKIKLVEEEVLVQLREWEDKDSPDPIAELVDNLEKIETDVKAMGSWMQVDQMGELQSSLHQIQTEDSVVQKEIADRKALQDFLADLTGRYGCLHVYMHHCRFMGIVILKQRIRRSNPLGIV